ncbi:PAS domain-containing protein [Mucilaginibacter ginsenosidivorans]|uniref:Uncharacterized protein n=1 Tax=Mucilaginibacter ginsenosidivorans TaxID=398053 RepID=A0A5B8UU76_9SPHI|nr:hypothetical protein [Mucilaginibacter ginsenosidivorans]QEC62472.1 hypothetical protein FRZ54_07690 [Mucilaginibacter ginsenosidivorans]
MKNKPEPVILDIHGTAFELDLEKQALLRADDRDTEISFIKQMTDHGDRYTFFYDTVARCAIDEPYEESRVRLVEIPPLHVLDPDGMAARYGKSPEELQGKTDFEIICDPDTLKQRREGILPQIDLAGEAFIVDLQLHELRNAKFFFPVISLKSFELTNDGWHYEAFYEPLMKQVVTIDPGILEFPEGIIKIKIPNELGLDPVATAKAYGLDERNLLRRYPISKDLKAEIIPLSETEIPRLIRQNKDKLRREHEQIMQRAKPRRRPRF